MESPTVNTALSILVEDIGYLYYCSTVSLVLAFIFLKRLYEQQQQQELGDETSQFFIAIRAILQKSVSPLLVSRNNYTGRCYYPMGFQWFCGQLTSIKIIQKIVLKIADRNRMLYEHIPKDIANRLIAGTTLIKLLSHLILPMTTLIVTSAVAIEIFEPTLYSLVTTVACLFLLNALFPLINYTISTRSIGHFCTSLPLLALFLYYEKFNSQSIVANNFLILAVLVTSLFVFLCSQQASQFFISICISTLIFDWNTGIKILATAGLAVFILIQFPKLNFFGHTSAVLLNRYYAQKWIEKTYGQFRYKLNILKGAQLKCLINDIFRFDYVTNNYETSYKKRNWLSLFLVHRTYLYSLLLIIFVNTRSTSSPEILLLKIILSSALMPALLCNFNPLKGFGPPALYMNFFAGFNCMLSCIILSSIIQNNTNVAATSLLMYLTFADCLGITIKGILHTLKSVIKTFGQKIYVNQAFADVPGNQQVTEIFNLLINLKANTKKDITIVTPEHHLQSLLEAACLIRQELGSSFLIKPAWQMIDSFQYGYYQDFVNHGVRIDVINKYAKPDLVLLDMNRPESSAYLSTKPADLPLVWKSRRLRLYNSSSSA